MPLPDPWSARGAETGKFFLKIKAKACSYLAVPMRVSSRT